MQVGMMMVFASDGWENCPDARVWDEEIRLARFAVGRDGARRLSSRGEVGRMAGVLPNEAPGPTRG
jgi:hypothetical protein